MDGYVGYDSSTSSDVIWQSPYNVLQCPQLSLHFMLMWLPEETTWQTDDYFLMLLSWVLHLLSSRALLHYCAACAVCIFAFKHGMLIACRAYLVEIQPLIEYNEWMYIYACSLGSHWLVPPGNWVSLCTVRGWKACPTVASGLLNRNWFFLVTDVSARPLALEPQASMAAGHHVSRCIAGIVLGMTIEMAIAQKYGT